MESQRRSQLHGRTVEYGGNGRTATGIAIAIVIVIVIVIVMAIAIALVTALGITMVIATASGIANALSVAAAVAVAIAMATARIGPAPGRNLAAFGLLLLPLWALAGDAPADRAAGDASTERQAGAGATHIVPRFADVSAAAVRGTCASKVPFGFSMADWDGDGRVDLQVWSHYRDSHCLWLNDGDGGFDVAPEWRAGTEPRALGLHVGCCGWNVQVLDLDGDGDNDAIGRTTEGEDGYLENTSRSEPAARFRRGPWGHRVTFGIADLDGDGELEIVQDGPVAFAPRSGRRKLRLGKSETSPLVFDWNGDSWPDILEPGGGAWLNDGGGDFTRVEAGGDTRHCTASRTLIFDWNLDGFVDLFCWQPGGKARIRVLENLGGEGFRLRDHAELGDPRFQTLEGIASKSGHFAEDLNNDGYKDVSLHDNEQLQYLLLNDGRRFTNVGGPAVWGGRFKANWSVRTTTAPHDYDGDGRLDILSWKPANFGADTMTAVLWRNVTPEPGNYVQVLLRCDAMGRGGNTDCVGASVRLYEPGTDRLIAHDYRAVKSFQQHVPNLAHLGAGDAERVDLVIQWPSGFGVDRFPDLPANAQFRAVYRPGGESRLAPWRHGEPYAPAQDQPAD